MAKQPTLDAFSRNQKNNIYLLVSCSEHSFLRDGSGYSFSGCVRCVVLAVVLSWHPARFLFSVIMCRRNSQNKNMDGACLLFAMEEALSIDSR